MNIDEIYNPLILNLFTQSFELIYNNSLNDNYSWNNIKPLFIDIFNKLKISKNKNSFLKNYYIFTFIFLNYTNYLKFIKHQDFNNEDIYKFYNKIKFSSEIINIIFSNFNDKNIKNIIKITNPFYDYKINSETINNYINNTKQMEKLSEMSNKDSKKILNIIIFRFVHSTNLNFKNYNEFFFKRIINNYNKNILNFSSFIKKIPDSKNLLSIKVDEEAFNLNMSLIKIINFFINKNNYLVIEKNEKNKIILTNKKYGGFININIDQSINSIEFNHYQNNYNLIHYNLCDSKELNFLKKSYNFIEINLLSSSINDLSILLHVVHLITISVHFLESYPNDLYECIYPIDYSQYYFNSFCNFFEIIKPLVNKNMTVNKFIIDLIKYLFIYSYYDFFFYYSNNLIETIISNFKHKYSIFNEFLGNLKNNLKLPSELFPHPPFFDINDDINSIIYYNFEIPSYLKLFDLLNAICYVFDYKYYKKNQDDNKIIDIIIKFFNFSNKKDFVSDFKSSSSSNYSDSSLSNNLSKQSDENNNENNNQNKLDKNNLFQSKINFEIISKFNNHEKILISNNNTYLELNDNDDSNDYMLNTEI